MWQLCITALSRGIAGELRGEGFSAGDILFILHRYGGCCEAGGLLLYQKYGGSRLRQCVMPWCVSVVSYALAMMFRDYPERDLCSEKDSPMIWVWRIGESYIASDVLRS